MNVFFVPLIAYLCAVVIKFIIAVFDNGSGHIMRKTFGNGGFPSSHNSIFFSIATISFLETGLSLISTLSLWLALTIASDSFNTRGAITKNSITLNKLTKSKKHDVRVGHSWFEIFSGAILGIIVALLIYYLF